MVITNREEYEAFLDKLLAENLVKYSTRRRQDTSWHIIVYINFYEYTISNHPIGCCGKTPNHLSRSKAVITSERHINDELYTKNPCIFSVISMSLGNQLILSIPVLQLMRMRLIYVIELRRQHQSLLAPKLIGKGTYVIYTYCHSNPGP